MPSIRSFSRARTRERGVVLAAALIIAVLYFALMELLLIDGTHAFREAQRFRSYVIAAALAESGAELAAEQMVGSSGGNAKGSDAQGSMTGKYTRSGDNFEIVGDGIASGVPPASAHVRVQGRIVDGSRIAIDFATHSQ